jgi:hypothetical protein
MMSCASVERFSLDPKVENRSFSVSGDQNYARFKNIQTDLKSAV